MRAYTYFTYLIYKAIWKLNPKFEGKYFITASYAIIFNALFIFGFIINYVYPRMFHYIAANTAVGYISAISFFGLNYILLFMNKEQKLATYKEFDKLPYRYNVIMGLLILSFVAGVVILSIRYYVIHLMMKTGNV